jgi:hypothetical protein
MASNAMPTIKRLVITIINLSNGDTPPVMTFENFPNLTADKDLIKNYANSIELAVTGSDEEIDVRCFNDTQRHKFLALLVEKSIL